MANEHLERLHHLNGVTPVNSFTTLNHANTLAAGDDESLTVPADAKWAVFSANADFWASDATMASVPTGDVTDGTSPLLNPVVVAVSNVTTIYIIAAQATEVVTSFYL